MNYTTFTTQLALFFPIASSDPNFQSFLPGCIEYGEGRVYREGDFLAEKITDTTGVLSTASRTFSLSTAASANFQIIEQFSVLTPAGAISSAARTPVRFTSQAVIDSVYGSAVNGNGVPVYAARTNATTILLGPTPDQPYSVEITGTIQPVPLSSGNSSTWLTQYLPDVFFAACMVYAAGYMKDFGSQSDNPQLAQSWEAQYKTLFTSANIDELRKMFRSQGWTPAQPNQISTPPRV